MVQEQVIDVDNNPDFAGMNFGKKKVKSNLQAAKDVSKSWNRPGGILQYIPDSNSPTMSGTYTAEYRNPPINSTSENARGI